VKDQQGSDRYEKVDDHKNQHDQKGQIDKSGKDSKIRKFMKFGNVRNVRHVGESKKSKKDTKIVGSNRRKNSYSRVKIAAVHSSVKYFKLAELLFTKQKWLKITVIQLENN